MSDPAVPPTQRFVLRAAPPVRPLAIGASAAIIGALVLVLGQAAGLPVVVAVLGILLLVAGVLLAAAAVILAARLRVEVLLDASAITVTRMGRRRSVPWSEVRQVTLTHPRMEMVTKESDRGVILVNPRGPQDPRFLALVSQIQQRLDADRGYRSLE